jgi:hypothetical protein
MGAIIGTLLHIVGWDFVSVRGQELREVKQEIAKLHRNDTMQVRNQDSMLGCDAARSRRIVPLRRMKKEHRKRGNAS